MVPVSVASAIETKQADIKAFRIILRIWSVQTDPGNYHGMTGILWNRSIACSPLYRLIGLRLVGVVLKCDVREVGNLENSISQYQER